MFRFRERFEGIEYGRVLDGIELPPVNGWGSSDNESTNYSSGRPSEIELPPVNGWGSSDNESVDEDRRIANCPLARALDYSIDLDELEINDESLDKYVD